MLEKVVNEGLLHGGAHVGFFSGVGMLLPTLSQAWNLNIKPWLYSPWGFYVAVALILVSVLIIAFLAGSASKLLRKIGWLIIIPGVLALVFAAFGEMQVFSWANNNITGFSYVEPGVQWFVGHSVPTTALMGGFYIVLGYAFLAIGRRVSGFAERI
ncbi:hypothetical protein HY492_02630 [Candidatus Woesearchaeota archaeon]|nr:hypothetical protein [Candidatus Woesearchaeota archaeon]